MRAESNDLFRGDAWSRRRFLQTSGLALGGLSLTGVSIGAGQEQSAAQPTENNNRLANWTIYVPVHQTTGNAGLKDGKICVVGWAEYQMQSPNKVDAKIYSSDPTVAGDSSKPTHMSATNPSTGVIDSGSFGGATYNFRFDALPSGQDNQWLVLWASIDNGTNWSDPEIVPINCVDIGHTDCEIAWFDSFTLGAGEVAGDPVVDHAGEITPLGYAGSEDWGIVPAAGGVPNLAHGDHGAGTGAELYFDPGVTAFTANHTVRIADKPLNGDGGSMWATRAFRRQGGGDKWNWQINHFKDGAGVYAFHELAKWEGGFASTEVAADLDLNNFTPGNTYPCILTVSEMDFSATFGAEEPLAVTSDDFAAETGQSFDAYYDIAPGNLPDKKTAFANVKITFDGPGAAKRAAPTESDAERNHVKIATVLCRLDNTLPGNALATKTWRPKGFLAASRAAGRICWKWTARVGIGRPESGKQPIGLYVVSAPESHVSAAWASLFSIDDDPGCVILTNEMTEEQVAERRTKINSLLALGGVESIPDRPMKGDAATDHIRGKMASDFTFRKHRRWRATYARNLARLKKLKDDAEKRNDERSKALLDKRLAVLRDQCKLANGNEPCNEN